MEQQKFGHVVGLSINGAAIAALVIQSQLLADGEHLNLIYLNPSSGANLMSGAAADAAIVRKFGALPLAEGGKNGWFPLEQPTADNSVAPLAPEGSDRLTLLPGASRVHPDQVDISDGTATSGVGRPFGDDLSDENRQSIQDGKPVFVREYEDGTTTLGDRETLAETSVDGSPMKTTFEHPESIKARAAGTAPMEGETRDAHIARVANQQMVQSQPKPMVERVVTANTDVPLVTDTGYDRAIRAEDAAEKLADAKTDEPAADANKTVQEGVGDKPSDEPTTLTDMANNPAKKLHGEELPGTQVVGDKPGTLTSSAGLGAADNGHAASPDATEKASEKKVKDAVKPADKKAETKGKKDAKSK